jgi:hypothetical protein
MRNRKRGSEVRLRESGTWLGMPREKKVEPQFGETLLPMRAALG